MKSTGQGTGKVTVVGAGFYGSTTARRRCNVDGKPLTDLLAPERIEEIVGRIRNGGAEVVALLKTGSAYCAPSAAAARMAKAVQDDSGATMPVCAWVDGQDGIFGVYLGVEAELGRKGVRRVVESDLTRAEREALIKAAEAVRAKQADVQNLRQTTARRRGAAWLDETEQKQ